MVSALLLLSTTSQQKPDLTTMHMAKYMAGSMAKDPRAPGGFGTSDHLPSTLAKLNTKTKELKGILKKTGQGFSMTLANGSKVEAWFGAGDGRILAWLEAKDSKGKWQPIEFLPWYSCGNSYHRVQLAAGYGWNWKVKIPTGGFETKVRWHYRSGKESMVSNEVQASIPITRFQLNTALRKTSEIRTDWGTPTLMPKNFGR